MTYYLDQLTTNNLHLLIEFDQFANPHPWGEQNFNDSLQENYLGFLLFLNEKNILVAYVIALKQFDHLEVMNIVTHPKYRKMGLGKKLLATIVEYSIKNQLDSISLEVRKNNFPAINLYQHFDFQIVANRKNYYLNTNGEQEDALVMIKKLV